VKKGFRLRYWLTGAFTLVAIIPITFLGVWIERTAYDNELQAVEEKHLLLAYNVTAALERYSADTRAALKMFATVPSDASTQAQIGNFAESLGFRHFCLVDAEGRIEQDFLPEQEALPAIDESLTLELLAAALPTPIFLPVQKDASGRPTIFLVQARDDGGAAIGALSTDYIVHLGQMIDFGNKGHATIVDQIGNVIAHPNPAWIEAGQSLAGVSPVQKMMQGESGVELFYSPAVDKDMITGFTVVNSTGWGVMVPQPISELEDRAQTVLMAALVVLLGGVGVAVVLAWLAAGVLTRPLERAVQAAAEIGGGQYSSRMPEPSALAPREVRSLSNEFNRMAHRIEEARDVMLASLKQLRRADRAKSDFLANTSHELRTPLNAIVGFTEILDREIYGPLGSPKYREYTKNILVSARLLVDVIEDILDLSKLEAGKFNVVDSEFTLREVVDEAITLIRAQAAGEGIILAVRLTDDLPPIVGSRSKIKQIVLNLLTNAIKFTGRGGSVTISAALEEDGSLMLRVHDTGVGMGPDQVRTALTPFGQIEDPFQKSHPGVGLGLPLAKRLMEVHQGSLEVDSAPGIGTTVTLYFPADRVVRPE